MPSVSDDPSILWPVKHTGDNDPSRCGRAECRSTGGLFIGLILHTFTTSTPLQRAPLATKTIRQPISSFSGTSLLSFKLLTACYYGAAPLQGVALMAPARRGVFLTALASSRALPPAGGGARTERKRRIKEIPLLRSLILHSCNTMVSTLF